MNALEKLIDQGQSWWLDDLSRAMIVDGSLRRRVAEQGLRGITSNPSTFEKALADGDYYEDMIRDGVDEGLSVEALYERLMVADVQDGADILLPVFEASRGRDGFVSLEVSPRLARDTNRSMEAARRLHAAVDRPNLMIKIPGTVEGIPAVEELLREGINVNITLLFAVPRYEVVADTYMRALEQRVAMGKDVGRTASVASFFLSRIDTAMDDLLQARAEGENGAEARALLGKVAVANAKIAYRRFRAMCGSERWRALVAKGAAPQRLLWASTSTKNPDYRDVMYVEPLIGTETVNTMPATTVEAFADHGQVEPTLARDGAEAEATMDRVRRLGIDMAAVTARLEEEGIAKFVASFDAAMSTLASRVQAIRRELGPQPARGAR